MQRSIKIGMMSLCLITSSAHAIIGGQLANEADFRDVVRVHCGLGSASATVVGEFAILIPASIKEAGDAKCRLSTHDGIGMDFVAYDLPGQWRGPGAEINLAIGVASSSLARLMPAAIGGTLMMNATLVVAGFGCTLPGGGGSTGVLHSGSADVEDIAPPRNPFTFATYGSALCYGDAGSPAFATTDNGKATVVGIGSEGNIKDLSWYVDLTNQTVRELLRQAAELRNVDVCGINATCDDGRSFLW